MEFMYKPDDYEAKLIVFYAIKKLRRSPSYSVLNQVVSSSVDINYFELQEYVQAVLDMGSVEEHTIDGETVYDLAESGEEAFEFFSERIPKSVRSRIDEITEQINNDRSDRNKIYADYIPLNEKEYKVVCGIVENNIKLLSFELYAGSKERAKKICEYFKEHTEDFYMTILSDIEKNISDKNK